MREYLGVLDQGGWEESHVMQAPLSSERFNAGVVAVTMLSRHAEP